MARSQQRGRLGATPTPRIRRRLFASQSRRIALLGLVLALSSAVPASYAAASGDSSGATLTVSDENGQAAELLHRLTLPQLAAVLDTTPAQLSAHTEATGVEAGLQLGELLSNPTATLQDLINFLEAHGVSTAPLEQFVNRLLGGVGETADQLRTTVASVLADLAADGQTSSLAHELALPTAAVEAVELLPSSAERVASSLNTTTSRLGSALASAGATTQPIAGSAPLVAAPVSRVAERGTSVLVGTPSGSGGLTLTTVSSSTPASSPAAAPISNAFAIVSIKVTKGGLLLETVKLPSPGRVTIKATTTKKTAVAVRAARRRTIPRNATVASIARNLSAGTHTLTLRPSGLAHRARRLAVKLATTYAPVGGSPRTIARTATIKRASPKKAGRRH